MDMTEEVMAGPEPAMPGTEPSDAPDAPGIIRRLAELPSQTILTEAAVAGAFGVNGRTIRRMVGRGELPPPIALGGRSAWIGGRILAHLDARAERAARDAERRAAALRRVAV